MFKDFDTWNAQKKEIHESGENKFYGPREVWWCSLGTNIGFEQDGTGEAGERPVLVLKGFSKDVCLVIPLTTSTKKNLYHVPMGEIDGRKASAIISQIRLVDTKRFINKVTMIEESLFEEIRKAVKNLI